MQPQVQALRRGVEMLVATPGRLLDHVRRCRAQAAKPRCSRCARSSGARSITST
jgi:superfamily II DNA/RNA helicase